MAKEFETIGTIDECLEFCMFDAPAIAFLEILERAFLFTANNYELSRR